MEPRPRWNGETCEARRCVVVLPAHDPERHPELAWWKPFAGATRHAVEVAYAGRTFYLDDEGYERSEEELAFLRERRDALPEEFRDAISVRQRVGWSGWGWAKVLSGGSPRAGHASLPDDVTVLSYHEQDVPA